MVVQEFPAFRGYWDAWRAEWGEGEGLCGYMSPFSNYVEDFFLCEPVDGEAISRAFRLMEQMLVDGDQGVRDAVTTCFLENFLNRDRIKPQVFGRYLGPESYAFCKEYDRFTGVESEY
jgi:hypothetical protein